MQNRWLHEWFAFGVFASWTSALLISTPTTGRWAGEDAVCSTPSFGLFAAVLATAPLYLRTHLSNRRSYRHRFAIPLIVGLLHAPLTVGTLWLAVAACPPATLDAMAGAVMLGWPILLGEITYRECRVD